MKCKNCGRPIQNLGLCGKCQIQARQEMALAAVNIRTLYLFLKSLWRPVARGAWWVFFLAWGVLKFELELGLAFLADWLKTAWGNAAAYFRENYIFLFLIAAGIGAIWAGWLWVGAKGG